MTMDHTATKFQIEDMLNAIPIGIINVDLDGNIIFANHTSLEILGVEKSWFEGRKYDDESLGQVDLEGNSIDSEIFPLTNVLKGGESVKGFVQGIKKGSETIWISVDAAPLYDESGVRVGGVSSFTDISEKVQLEKEYHSETTRNKHFSASVGAVFWEWSLVQDKLTFVGPKVKEILGYSAKERAEKGFWEKNVYPDDFLKISRYHNEQVSKGQSHELEYRFVKKDGEVIWIKDIIEVIVENGEAATLRGLMVNVTKQKEVTEKLMDTETKYGQLINEAPFAISIHNKDGILVNANEAFESIWDINSDDIIGKFNINKEKKFHEGSLDGYVEKAMSGEKGMVNSPFTTPKGVEKNLQIKYFPLHNSKGELKSVVFLTEDVSAILEAERRASVGEALKQGILNSLDDAILVVDKEGIIISVNQRLKSYIHGSPYQDVRVGGVVFDFIDFFDEKELIKSGLEKVLDRSATFFDYETRLADNKWYNLKVTQLKNPYGAVISWQNINTRKEIELALEKSLKKYRNIYNRAPVMMHSINQNGEIMSVSDFWLEKMGYERKEVIGRKTSEFLADEEQRIAYDVQMSDYFEYGSSKNIPFQFQTKDDRVLDLLLSANSEYDETGNFERSLTGMIDVTDLKKTERELLESRQRLIEAQRISRIGNYELDLIQYTFKPSYEVVAMMGLNEEDRDFKLIDNLIHPSDRAEFMSKLEHSAKTGEDFFYIYRIFHLKTKKLRWISGRGKVIQNERGENVRMIGTVQDISEQKVAEDKIRRLSERILLATELAEIGVWEYTFENDEIFWDKQMYEIFEGIEEPIKSLKILSTLMLETDRDQLWEVVSKIGEGYRFVEQDFRMQINGSIKFLRTYNRIIRSEDGEIQRIIGVMYDNTRDKELQLKLESSLEEKNILLKEVHHRVKNNMQLVSSILALKSYDLVDDKSKEVFAEINERIKSMAVIHDQLYKFYNVSEINISEYLNHIARELSILMGSEGREIKVSSVDKLFEVDKVLLFGLIVSELVSNAFKHSFRNEDEGLVEIIFESNGKQNILSVINNGEKMDQSILNNKSSGLGMSLIKTFAKQLNGSLSLSERNGFEVQFTTK